MKCRLAKEGGCPRRKHLGGMCYTVAYLAYYRCLFVIVIVVYSMCSVSRMHSHVVSH